MLEINGLSIHYGSVEVVSGVTMRVDEGKIVALIGPNGAGKSSILRAVSGLIRPSSGEIVFRGINLTGLPPHEIAAAGIAHVMEGRHLFGGLTVEDNLLLAGSSKATTSAGSLEAILQRWPILAQRRQQVAGSLSGGEQQLLAIGRALMARPHLLMLDEPSWGLAPLLVRELMNTFVKLRSEGMTILLVEQMAKMALQICDYGYVMASGSIVMQGSAQELLANPDLQASYLGGKVSLDKTKEISVRPSPGASAEQKLSPSIPPKSRDWQQREKERESKEKRLRDAVSPSQASLRAPVEGPRHALPEILEEKERLRLIRQQTFRSEQKIFEKKEDWGRIRKEISTPAAPEGLPHLPPTSGPADRRSFEIRRQERQAAWKAGTASEPGVEGGKEEPRPDWRARELARKESQRTFEREGRTSQTSDLLDHAARERERQKCQEEWKNKVRSGSREITSVPSSPSLVKDRQELEIMRMEKEKAWQSRGIPASNPEIIEKTQMDRKNKELAREQRQAAWQKKKQEP